MKNIIATLLSLIIILNNIVYAKPENNFEFILPDKYGKITESFDAVGSNSLVYIIQDAHCNREAQNNISKIITQITKFQDTITKQSPITNNQIPNKVCVGKGDSLGPNVQLLCRRLSSKLRPQLKHDAHIIIGLEGASSRIDRSILKNLPNNKLKNKLLNHLLDTGYITGAELYDIKNPGKAVLYGLEDEKVYNKDFEFLYNSLKYRKYLNILKQDIKANLKYQKHFFYTKSLQTLEKLINKYKNKKISLKKHLNKLKKISDEYNIDVKRYRNISILLNKKNPNNQSVDPIALLSELAELERALKLAVVDYDEELKELISFIWYLNLFEGCINSNLSSVNFELLKKHEHILFDKLKPYYRSKYQETKVKQAYQNIMNFYELAIKRNEIMVSKMLNLLQNNQIPRYNKQTITNNQAPRTKQNRTRTLKHYNTTALNHNATGIMVVGGFHTKGITEILRSKGISYKVIMPKINNFYKKEIYIKRLLEHAKFMGLTDKNLSLLDLNSTYMAIIAKNPELQSKVTEFLYTQDLWDKSAQEIIKEFEGYTTVQEEAQGREIIRASGYGNCGWIAVYVGALHAVISGDQDMRKLLEKHGLWTQEIKEAYQRNKLLGLLHDKDFQENVLQGKFRESVHDFIKNKYLSGDMSIWSNYIDGIITSFVKQLRFEEGKLYVREVPKVLKSWCETFSERCKLIGKSEQEIFRIIKDDIIKYTSTMRYFLSYLEALKKESQLTQLHFVILERMGFNINLVTANRDGYELINYSTYNVSEAIFLRYTYNRLNKTSHADVLVRVLNRVDSIDDLSPGESSGTEAEEEDKRGGRGTGVDAYQPGALVTASVGLATIDALREIADFIDGSSSSEVCDALITRCFRDGVKEGLFETDEKYEVFVYDSQLGGDIGNADPDMAWLEIVPRHDIDDALIYRLCITRDRLSKILEDPNLKEARIKVLVEHEVSELGSLVNMIISDTLRDKVLFKELEKRGLNDLSMKLNKLREIQDQDIHIRKVKQARYVLNILSELRIANSQEFFNMMQKAHDKTLLHAVKEKQRPGTPPLEWQAAKELVAETYQRLRTYSRQGSVSPDGTPTPEQKVLGERLEQLQRDFRGIVPEHDAVPEPAQPQPPPPRPKLPVRRTLFEELEEEEEVVRAEEAHEHELTILDQINQELETHRLTHEDLKVLAVELGWRVLNDHNIRSIESKYPKLADHLRQLIGDENYAIGENLVLLANGAVLEIDMKTSSRSLMEAPVFDFDVPFLEQVNLPTLGHVARLVQIVCGGNNEFVCQVVRVALRICAQQVDEEDDALFDRNITKQELEAVLDLKSAL